jgi:hypothetical protein
MNERKETIEFIAYLVACYIAGFATGAALYAYMHGG